MGDYGFKGVGEFGGNSVGENFHCLPDYHFTKCPYRKQGLGGDFDNEFWCKLTGRADADCRGWGYDKCNFCGDSYEECSLFLRENPHNS